MTSFQKYALAVSCYPRITKPFRSLVKMIRPFHRVSKYPCIWEWCYATSRCTKSGCRSSLRLRGMTNRTCRDSNWALFIGSVMRMGVMRWFWFPYPKRTVSNAASALNHITAECTVFFFIRTRPRSSPAVMMDSLCGTSPLVL